MAQNVFASLGEKADRKFSQIADVSREKLEEIKKKSMGNLYSDTKAWVQHNPGKTLLGALATGFMVGWLLRRK